MAFRLAASRLRQVPRRAIAVGTCIVLLRGLAIGLGSRPRRPTGFLAIALLWLLGSAAAQADGRFIALSDIHFDPTASGMAQALAAAPPEDWAGLLDRSPAGDYAHYGADTTWPLLRSALAAMQAADSDPAFLVLTGDLLAHEFRLRFTASTHDPDQTHFASFAVKTIAFIAQQMEARFPGKRIFLALGNNDTDCGDYQLVPDGDFLHATLPVIRRMLGLAPDAGFDADWISGRGFDVANGAIPGLRMIFVNSVFLSRNYTAGCGANPAADPGTETLDWLEHWLAAAEQAGEKVWILLHIPPGADAYADLRSGQCPNALLPMWKDDYTRRFIGLAQRYNTTVAASFAGHTHMDEFRLIGQGGAPSAFTLGTPGISPIFGQNPGFHVYSYGETGQLRDRATWYVSNLPATGTAVAPEWRQEYDFTQLWGLPSLDLPATGTAVAPEWRQEYDFTQLWGLPSLDLPALGGLNMAILDDKDSRAKWFSIYRVGNTAVWRVPDGVDSLPDKVFRAYHCAIGHVDPDEYRHCYCDGARP